MSNEIFTAILLPIALVIIMMSLGVTLTVQDFRRVVVFPKGVGVGLVNLLLISPALAFGLAWGFGLSGELAVGMVLLGAAPGGTMANMLTHLARGDTALSVTMTAVSSLASVFTMPLFLGIALAVFMDGSSAQSELHLAPIVLKILLITLVPLSIGMVLRAKSPALAEKLGRPLRLLALGFFVLVAVAAIWSERKNMGPLLEAVGLAVVAFNLLAMSISYACASIVRLDPRQSTAVAIELGVHNTTLSMTVGGMITMAMTIPGAVYGVFMFITAGLFAWLMARRNAPGQAAALAATTAPE